MCPPNLRERGWDEISSTQRAKKASEKGKNAKEGTAEGGSLQKLSPSGQDRPTWPSLTAELRWRPDPDPRTMGRTSSQLFCMGWLPGRLALAQYSWRSCGAVDCFQGVPIRSTPYMYTGPNVLTSFFSLQFSAVASSLQMPTLDCEACRPRRPGEGPVGPASRDKQGSSLALRRRTGRGGVIRPQAGQLWSGLRGLWPYTTASFQNPSADSSPTRQVAVGADQSFGGPARSRGGRQDVHDACPARRRPARLRHSHALRTCPDAAVYGALRMPTGKTRAVLYSATVRSIGIGIGIGPAYTYMYGPSPPTANPLALPAVHVSIKQGTRSRQVYWTAPTQLRWRHSIRGRALGALPTQPEE